MTHGYKVFERAVRAAAAAAAGGVCSSLSVSVCLSLLLVWASGVSACRGVIKAARNEQRQTERAHAIIGGRLVDW